MMKVMKSSVTTPELSDAVAAAQAMLGWELCNETSEGIISGIIVETEAYTSSDPASHSFRGQTSRNTPMFGPAGTVYVYFTYGMHFCMNIVTGEPGDGQAVLIRALEPKQGLEQMKRHRGVNEVLKLTNGPAKLTQALAIGQRHSGASINQGPLSLRPGRPVTSITAAERIGIRMATEYPWRFYDADSPYVSKR